nr:uncharacterized protein c20f10.03 [Quercus suber]
MRERNLLKQALESDKTTSRKARSKQVTPSSSRAGSTVSSPRASRLSSANTSDDEGDYSDGTQWGTGSIDALIGAAAGDDAGPETWVPALEDVMNDICDRKRSSAEGRAESINGFVLILSRHYAKDEVKPKLDELLPVLCKSVKSGQTEKEVVLALKALALILVTEPNDDVYDSISGTIKNAISDATHPQSKIAAIHALSVATYYGGASEEEVEDIMDLFLDIASTDGEAVGEANDAALVTAAMEEWGFLATSVTPSSSRAGSTVSSPRASRLSSANTSDDEGDYSDGTQWGTGSIDALIGAAAGDDAGPETWVPALEDVMNDICDRKRSSAEGRAESINGFVLILSRHYAKDEVKPKLDELLPVLCKSVKSGQTEKEVVLALKALALILVTEPNDDVYDSISGTIKNAISDATHPQSKIAAIHALSVATYYGGASEEEVEDIMDLFLDIASTDGEAVGEANDAALVTAAMEEWGFLATSVNDLETTTEVAMDTFVDQLESSDVDVQIVAGENIALLFEKSYTEAESDDELRSDDASVEKSRTGGLAMIKRYTVYRQVDKLTEILEGLAKASSKRLSKKDKKSLHQAFADVLSTVEKPTRGPRYSTALDDEGREYGSRLKVTVHGGGKMTIDTWWKLHRLNALKRLLQGGFLEHYENNEVVFESLPVILEDA